MSKTLNLTVDFSYAGVTGQAANAVLRVFDAASCVTPISLPDPVITEITSGNSGLGLYDVVQTGIPDNFQPGSAEFSFNPAVTVDGSEVAPVRIPLMPYFPTVSAGSGAGQSAWPVTRRTIKAGSTSKLATVMITNVADGTPATGLLYNTAGLVISYLREGNTSPVAITPVAMSVGTWVSSGFKEVDSVKSPGLYQIGLPNIVCAEGAATVQVFVNYNTNTALGLLDIELVAYDPQNAADLGLSTVRNGSPDPSLCRVTGFLFDSEGRPAEASKIAFSLANSPTTVGNVLVETEALVRLIGSTGEFQVDLYREKVYKVTASTAKLSNYEITIPDSDSATFASLIG